MSSRISIALALFAFAVVVLPAPGSFAQSAEEITDLGTFQDWRTFSFLEGGNKVCYMLSVPTQARHGNRQRGDIYALVTHRPAQESFNVVSFIAGYTYKPGSEVTVNIGSRSFKLFTEGDGAWARDGETDRALVAAIRRGLTMEVRGESSRGTQTRDTYSLRGSSSALDAINRGCNVQG